MTHWIILPVVLPALMGAVLVGLRAVPRAQRVVSLAGSLSLLGLAIILVWGASSAGPEAYRLGNWPAPFGIVLMLDRLSALMLLLTAATALITLVYAMGSGWDVKAPHFHALWQFQLMGLNGAFLTADAFNLFVFFEVLLIASYGLMVHDGGGARSRAGVQYVAVNLVGSTLFLFALATIYAVSGTLNMADLALRLADLPEGDAGLMRAAAVMLMLVFAVKGALVPLQFWLPGTYAAAPGVVAALFALMTKVGAYAMLRFGTLVFPQGSAVTGSLVADLLWPAALLTLALGAVGVLGAAGLPRKAAFAAIASMGTLFLAIAGFTPQSTAAALYYLVHSTLAGAAMFLIVDQLVRRRTPDAAAPSGDGTLAALYFAAAIAIAGLPPFSGFIGKLLVLVALREDAPVVWSLILISSLIITLGLVREGSALFWRPDRSALRALREPVALAMIVLLVVLLAGLSLASGPVTAWLEATAFALHDPAGYISANTLYAEPGP